MTIGKTHKSISKQDVFSLYSEEEILANYFGITQIPCLICSPLRKDVNPSFGIYQTLNGHIHYIDYATRQGGDLFDMLCKYWHCSFNDALAKIYSDIVEKDNLVLKTNSRSAKKHKNRSEIQVAVRAWKKHDIDYWSQYGIGQQWLQYADVYPISHKIINKDGKRMVFAADRYAYVYVEHKDGNTSLKIYQPFNKQGFKWTCSMDGSVISLWTKITNRGEAVCICSSLKDALCLWCNTGIPTLALQGEGYTMSKSAVDNLKSRFNHVFILFDNDPPGLSNGEKLASATGFTNLVLPQFKGGKDISDFYKTLDNKSLFKKQMMSLFYPYMEESVA